MRILYRAQQFWDALHASLTEKELAQVREVLNHPPLLALFLRLQPNEQAHSFQVLKHLQEHEPHPPELLAAALLHDVGKSRLPLRVWERVLIVLGKKFFPRQAQRWGQDGRRGWRPFIVAEQHANWGAEMAGQAGAHPLTVALIRRHQESLPEVFTERVSYLSLDSMGKEPTLQSAHLVDGRDLENQLLYRLQSADNER